MTHIPATTDRPEFERLAKRLGVDEGRLIDFHVSWGKDAASMTSEQRAGVINHSLDLAEAQEADRVSISRVEMTMIRDALKQLMRLGQAEVSDWLTMPKEVADLRHQIFALAEFPALFALQALERANDK